MSEISGILVVDKPKGYTSHDIVAITRKISGIKKVGHAGTLDPNATGVLVLLLGKATKLSSKLISHDKRYSAILKLGETTDTHDAEGVVTSRADDMPVRDSILKVLNGFKGEIEQVPPMFSAKQVKGKRLYDLARKGIDIEREPIKIRIEFIDLVKVDIPFIELDVLCSKGTYIRQLASDIGKELGCGAYLSDLRRTRSGDFKIEDAVSFDAVKDGDIEEIQRNIMPLEDIKT